MTGTLGDLLRRAADTASVPQLDLDGLLGEADKRQRRRRLAIAAVAAGAVAATAAGSVLVTRADPKTQQPPPAAPPSSTQSSNVAVAPHGARPLVYADGSTVHVGDATVEAHDPVAFIDATDDGAVYEAAYDGTLWFTDGKTSSVIGTTAFTAAPTAHSGVVTTGDSGSLVVWGDASIGENESPVEFVVYDTSRREEVARIPFTEPGEVDQVLYVDEGQVYVNPDPSTPGCWAIDVQDLHPCKHPHLFRFDVASGRTTKITLADLDAHLGTRARRFAVPAGGDLDLGARPGFSQVGQRLVHTDTDGDPTVLSTASGDEVRLRLPRGYRAPGGEGSGGMIAVSQWLDDDHVVLWADDGGGDLPAKEGDLLVCRLPDGTCRVAVPRSSRPYVVP
ncbi:hypothetical protein EKO23_11190 [Nocardioides guangzhouensis]|uniref:Uncharacterized protein n=1 Tax=Nocardioides guangzhouensis TaxID=2497878 RepID=A0A4V1XZ85_9ACTN|nr:hypothetical protein [Nocardioides guangzhouensis]RYP85869.1 hypothetical protein EKO23_11190 [Nocardioides guangzhouensis]